MKRLFAFLICIALLLPCTLSAGATAPKIVDNADLLSDSEEAALEIKAQALADAYSMDVVILTVWEYEGYSVSDYADDYFDYNGYGIGPDYSGVLLLLSMKERDWAISTCGDAIYALTDYGIQSVFSEISWYLSMDQYYFAFDTYLDELEIYFQAYADGDPIDGFIGDYDGPGYYEPVPGDGVVYYPEEEDLLSALPGILLISLLVGAAAGGIVLLIMRAQMNTAKAQSGAKNYMSSGTYSLYQQRDVFLYSNVSRVRRAESSSSSGGRSGGGSSIHRSSSGRSHGGGRGKF